MIQSSSLRFPGWFVKGSVCRRWLLQDGFGAEVFQQNVTHLKSTLIDAFINLAGH